MRDHRAGARLFPLLCALTWSFLTDAASISAPTCSGPGTERWPIKTSLPAGASIDKPKSVSLKELLALADPGSITHNDPRYQETRIPAVSNALNIKDADILQTTALPYLV